MLWLIISRCVTSSTVKHAWERLCSCKPHPSGAASRLNKLQLQFDPDLGGSASWINNMCISSGRKLNYLTLKATMERVTGCFLRGTRCLPVLCGGEGGREGWRGGQTEGCCCCIWMRAREIPPLCPSPPHFTLCKTASHPLFLPLSSLSDRHLIQLIWALVHLTALASVEWFYVCMRLQVSAFDTSRIIPFVQPSDLNFSAPPGSASVCIDQTFQLPKKK